jgi:hypothetical protein
VRIEARRATRPWATWSQLLQQVRLSRSGVRTERQESRKVASASDAPRARAGRPAQLLHPGGRGLRTIQIQLAVPMALVAWTVGGASYLVHLGVRTLQSPGHLRAGSAAVLASSPLRCLTRGVGVSALNPKGLLIFLSILPQFTQSATGWPLPVQMATLGGSSPPSAPWSTCRSNGSTHTAVPCAGRVSGALVAVSSIFSSPRSRPERHRLRDRGDPRRSGQRRLGVGPRIRYPRSVRWRHRHTHQRVNERQFRHRNGVPQGSSTSKTMPRDAIAVA